RVSEAAEAPICVLIVQSGEESLSCSDFAFGNRTCPGCLTFFPYDCTHSCFSIYSTGAWSSDSLTKRSLWASYVTPSSSKETVFTLALRRCDPSFPAFFPGSRRLQAGKVEITTAFPSVAQVSSAFCPGASGLHLLYYE